MFYGRLAEAVGPELQVAASPDSSVAEIREQLLAQHPEIEDVLRSRRARTCVGNSLVHDDYRPAAGEALEFLPPVSGG